MKTTTGKKDNNIKQKKVKQTLDKCLSAPHPEMARNNDTDEPCEAE
ncbi:MAG TPA: hypothetical protein PK358_15410 [Spirochaetota bacterium]|nr:hypothetical protein [Spirochaetota bacterium]HPJ36228.1 hypothetical protein [Spirochaetota bacterium]